MSAFAKLCVFCGVEYDRLEDWQDIINHTIKCAYEKCKREKMDFNCPCSNNEVGQKVSPLALHSLHRNLINSKPY